jgi:hypothetical protein
MIFHPIKVVLLEVLPISAGWLENLDPAEEGYNSHSREIPVTWGGGESSCHGIQSHGNAAKIGRLKPQLKRSAQISAATYINRK